MQLIQIKYSYFGVCMQLYYIAYMGFYFKLPNYSYIAS